MKYTGVITRVQRGRADVILIVQTPIGLRGVALDRALWTQISPTSASRQMLC